MSKDDFKEWAKTIFAFVALFAFIAYLIWWTIFYFQHCAFTPVHQMPGICLNRS